MSILAVENLKKHFYVGRGSLIGRKRFARAVDGVSFELNANETLGLVGESGCGKSTLGRTVLKLLEPSGGTIRFHDEDLTRCSPGQMNRYRKKMQMIFQDPYASLNPRMSVRRIIAEPLVVHRLAGSKKAREDRVDELLHLVGLRPGVKSRFPNEFSGGQRQRIMIARVLASQPELLVADEAVSALDVSIQSQILNLMRELKEQLGMSYIFISHDLGVIRFISDRIAVMYLGTIVETAGTGDLLNRPLHPYTRSLVESVPSVRRRGRKKRYALKGDVPSLVNIPDGCRFHTRCPEALDICRHLSPEFLETAAGHHVSCHLYAGKGGLP